MNVVHLVIEDHQLRQPGQKLQHLEAVLRVRVFALRHLVQSRSGQQRVGRSGAVQVEQVPLVVALPQHFMRDDGVQDGLLLPGMKIKSAACEHHVFAKPPLEQFAGRWGNEFQNLCLA